MPAVSPLCSILSSVKRQYKPLVSPQKLFYLALLLFIAIILLVVIQLSISHNPFLAAQSIEPQMNTEKVAFPELDTTGFSEEQNALLKLLREHW